MIVLSDSTRMVTCHDLNDGVDFALLPRRSSFGKGAKDDCTTGFATLLPTKIGKSNGFSRKFLASSCP